ncbi:hypothetical protein [Pedobacter sp. Hv1]|uniref:hypothetical protein n=1 Tax=Pedobacter sp. Hv1 TaxID=1740090 RepID=UPI0006D8A419|nr:hypothetical protein [Pedobacter sp. Hv1]KQB99892.1 hypothetical protein AQF98_15370 [Pedobacter sp. Hv1]
MEAPTNSSENKVIKLATQYADTTYIDNDERRIAAKGYAIGYQQALSEKNAEIKELAGIVKLLLPGIGAVSPDNLKTLEEFIEKSDNR